MKEEGFQLQLISLNWLKHFDDPEDLCAHGKVYLKIGEEVLMDESSGDDWTVSAAGLHLMRTVSQNYKPDDLIAQLVPCCGFSMIAAAEREVQIIGCNVGFDWTIFHKADRVHHVTLQGTEATITLSDYKEQVKRFVDFVDQFYKSSLPKTFPKDDRAREGYNAFWAEWKYLRQQLS
jgi:hypothetical protein